MKKPNLSIISLFLLIILGFFSLNIPTVAAAGEVSVNNSNIAWSPYGWVANGSVYKQSPTVGSYINVAFTGTTLGLNVDASMVTAPAVPANIRISAYIDGNAPITRTLANVSSNQLMFTSSLSNGSHHAHIVIESNTNANSRWSYSGGEPISLLRVTSIQLEASGTTQSLATTPLAQTGPKILYYGDSITEGNGNGGTYGSQSHASILGEALDAQYGVHGYASQMWWFSLLSNTPDFNYPISDTVNFPTGIWINYYKNSSLLNTAHIPSSGYKEGTPDAVFNNLGVNDMNLYGVFGAGALDYFSINITDWLEQQRAVLGPRPAIFMVVPFNYNCTAQMQPSYNIANVQLYRQKYLDAINNYKTSNGDNRVFVINLGEHGCQIVVDNSSDKLHPDPNGAQLLGEEIASLAESNIILDTPLTTFINGQSVSDVMSISSPAVFSGTAPGSSVITITAQPGDHVCSTIVAVDGTWSCTFSSLNSGATYNVTISAQTTYDTILQSSVFTITSMAAGGSINQVSYLADTGDNVLIVALLGILLIVISVKLSLVYAKSIKRATL